MSIKINTKKKAKINAWKNKLRKEFMTACKKAHDWDYGYLLEIEYLYLKRLLYSIQNQETIEKDYHSIRYLKIAISCLEYCLDKHTFYDFILPKEENETWNLEKSYFKLKVNINTKNFIRFFEKTSKDFLNDEEIPTSVKIELYHRKAWHIYSQIRERYIHEWWW